MRKPESSDSGNRMTGPSMSVEVNVESPLQKDVIDMIEALDAYLGSLYPSTSNHLLSVESLAGENVRFVVAGVDERAVGCGALVLDHRWLRGDQEDVRGR